MVSLTPLCFFITLLIAGADAAAEPQTVRFDTGGLSRDTFPKGFLFGTATSAYQVEGMAHKDGRGPSIWDVFIKKPGIVANNGTGEVSVDQYHRYKEDIDLMASLNFDAYRFSISWSRIFPNGTGQVNWKGVAYYNRLINYLLEKGITPYANLYHYDLPLALEERYNGLLSRQVVKDFADYAEFCFKTFGDRVKNWMTFNEPRVVAALGYDNGFFAPGRCSKEYGNCTAGNSGTEPYIVAHNLILSHAAAVQRYRAKYQEKQKGRIGILLDFVWYEPLTRSKADNFAAQRARDFHIGWFIHPLVYGEYPKTIQNIVGNRLPKFTSEEVKIVKGSIDFVGINQYTTFFIYDPHQSKPKVPGYQMDWNAAAVFWALALVSLCGQLPSNAQAPATAPANSPPTTPAATSPSSGTPLAVTLPPTVVASPPTTSTPPTTSQPPAIVAPKPAPVTPPAPKVAPASSPKAPPPQTPQPQPPKVSPVVTPTSPPPIPPPPVSTPPPLPPPKIAPTPAKTPPAPAPAKATPAPAPAPTKPAPTPAPVPPPPTLAPTPVVEVPAPAPSSHKHRRHRHRHRRHQAPAPAPTIVRKSPPAPPDSTAESDTTPAPSPSLNLNAASSNHQQGRNIWATAALAIAVLLAVTGYSC